MFKYIEIKGIDTSINFKVLWDRQHDNYNLIIPTEYDVFSDEVITLIKNVEKSITKSDEAYCTYYQLLNTLSTGKSQIIPLYTPVMKTAICKHTIKNNVSYISVIGCVPVTCDTVPYKTVQQLIGDVKPDYKSENFETEVRVEIQSALYRKLCYTLIEQGVFTPYQYTSVTKFRSDHTFDTLKVMARSTLSTDLYTLLTQVMIISSDLYVLGIITL